MNVYIRLKYMYICVCVHMFKASCQHEQQCKNKSVDSEINNDDGSNNSTMKHLPYMLFSCTNSSSLTYSKSIGSSAPHTLHVNVTMSQKSQTIAEPRLQILPGMQMCSLVAPDCANR